MARARLEKGSLEPECAERSKAWRRPPKIVSKRLCADAGPLMPNVATQVARIPADRPSLALALREDIPNPAWPCFAFAKPLPPNVRTGGKLRLDKAANHRP